MIAQLPVWQIPHTYTVSDLECPFILRRCQQESLQKDNLLPDTDLQIIEMVNSGMPSKVEMMWGDQLHKRVSALKKTLQADMTWSRNILI